MKVLVNEYDNPRDTAIGASFISFQANDTTQMTFCYDGKMRAIVDEENNTIVIDSFKVRQLPFRPLSPPFFNYAKSIMKYALETNDSISVKLENREGAKYFSITILEDRQVEFFGKAHYMNAESGMGFLDPVSKYEIWINPSTGLPFKIRREMSHDISICAISELKINVLSIDAFRASNYFRPGYAIQAYRVGAGNSAKKHRLLGEKAPSWSLLDASGTTHSLNDMNNKTIVLQFTSVSCGPCRASIQFLNELATGTRGDNISLVAVECSTRSSNALKHYQNQNSIGYKFLMANNEVLKAYDIQSFPVFFILDREFIVKKVLYGYRVGSSDNEIISAIKNAAN